MLVLGGGIYYWFMFYVFFTSVSVRTSVLFSLTVHIQLF